MSDDYDRAPHCEYCGTLLGEDGTHYTATCREYVSAALRATKRELVALRAQIAAHEADEIRYLEDTRTGTRTRVTVSAVATLAAENAELRRELADAREAAIKECAAACESQIDVPYYAARVLRDRILALLEADCTCGEINARHCPRHNEAR